MLIMGFTRIVMLLATKLNEDGWVDAMRIRGKGELCALSRSV